MVGPSGSGKSSHLTGVLNYHEDDPPSMVLSSDYIRAQLCGDKALIERMIRCLLRSMR